MAKLGQLDVVATQDWDALLLRDPNPSKEYYESRDKKYGRVIKSQKINLKKC